MLLSHVVRSGRIWPQSDSDLPFLTQMCPFLIQICPFLTQTYPFLTQTYPSLTQICPFLTQPDSDLLRLKYTNEV